MQNDPVTDLLDKAIMTARGLPPEKQDEVARIVLAFLDDGASVYQCTPEEETELAEAAAARGEFATDKEMYAIWAKYGL